MVWNYIFSAFIRMPTIQATPRSPPPEPHMIQSAHHSTHKVLSTFHSYPISTSTRPLSTPIQLRQLRHEALARHDHDQLNLQRNTAIQEQLSFDETSNISNPRLPSQKAAVQSSTLPHTFSPSKRIRKSSSNNRHLDSEEGSVKRRRKPNSTAAAGDDADSESDSIDSIYKRLSGPQTSPQPIPECVRALVSLDTPNNIQ